MDFEYRRQTNTLNSFIQNAIKNTYILSFGEITQIIENNKVEVKLQTGQIIYALLIYPSFTGLSIQYSPSVKDRVLVFFPKDFDFNAINKDENILSNILSSYDILNAVCLPFADDKVNDKSNIIITADGKINIKSNGNEIDIDNEKVLINNHLKILQ